MSVAYRAFLDTAEQELQGITGVYHGPRGRRADHSRLVEVPLPPTGGVCHDVAHNGGREFRWVTRRAKDALDHFTSVIEAHECNDPHADALRDLAHQVELAARWWRLEWPGFGIERSEVASVGQVLAHAYHRIIVDSQAASPDLVDEVRQIYMWGGSKLGKRSRMMRRTHATLGLNGCIQWSMRSRVACTVGQSHLHPGDRRR